MNRKKSPLFLMMFFLQKLFAQYDGKVDLIARIEEIKLQTVEVKGIGPRSILVDEMEKKILISGGPIEKSIIIHILEVGSPKIKITNFKTTNLEKNLTIGDVSIGVSETQLLMLSKDKRITFIFDDKKYQEGIFLIAHPSNSNFFVAFVNKDGIPGVVDIKGNFFQGKTALDLLKSIDPLKYELSLARARELGLEEKFLEGKVLIWGRTYYQNARQWNSFWNESVFRATDRQIQYDLQGNAYQAVIRSKGEVGSEIWIVNPDAEYLAQIDVTPYSKILSTYEQGHIFSSSTYVGFGGNIYFYVAGDDFTEVFRIRRTWGDPDMYAMAVNGYTEDTYGEYVNKILEKMSKDDLRLLRNHVFALYGYDFKDAALKAHFDKQVWYLAKPEVSIASLELPEERRALIERIQKEESKR